MFIKHRKFFLRAAGKEAGFLCKLTLDQWEAELKMLLPVSGREETPEIREGGGPGPRRRGDE